jgi:hypothetical protein
LTVPRGRLIAESVGDDAEKEQKEEREHKKYETKGRLD